MAIRVLDPVVASRIAAGEVVENPSSMLRELLDNSIDAGSTSITVRLEEGGISSLSVSDNGCGMDRDDLEMACTSHATSKIKTLDDLFSLKTMGFRGEALPSIAACTKLTISTNGNRLFVDNGKAFPIVKDSSTKGCTVIAEDLFENIPARKQFLKRASSEATMCRKVLVEKAMCFENVRFLYYEDGLLKLELPKANKKKRVLDIMALDKDFVRTQAVEMESKGETVSLYAIASDPTCYRKDRGRVRIFVNDRPVDNFVLVQSVTNAYSVALPGGAFPYFSLFIWDDPSLVDFNVHPAKRECRMRNQSEVYALITSMIRKALLEKTYSNKKLQASEPVQHELPVHREFTYSQTHKNEPVSVVKESSQPFPADWFDKAKKIMEKKAQPLTAFKSSESLSEESSLQCNSPACNNTENNWTYIGQVFNTFLVVEKGSDLLLIDQHAAHERLLYDEIISLKNVQNLVVPYRFETDRGVDDYLLENSVVYQDLGVQLIRVKPMVWEITSVPATIRENEEKIANYIRNATGDIEEAKKGLFAIMACHSAIKAGDVLDRITAENLLKRVFELDALLCPHGRSFVFKLSKEFLYREVGRIV